MAAPALAVRLFPRMELADALSELRPDLEPPAIDALVDHLIAHVTAWSPQSPPDHCLLWPWPDPKRCLPSDAFLP
jgi:hypothetical protein